MISDSRKLKMVLDHHQEYYVNPREYLFFEEGFLSYEIYKYGNIKGIHFHEFYVSPEYRGKSIWRNIFQEADKLKDKYGLSVATCNLQKHDNPFLKKLNHIYVMWGFKIIEETDDELVYGKDLR